MSANTILGPGTAPPVNQLQPFVRIRDLTVASTGSLFFPLCEEQLDYRALIKGVDSEPLTVLLVIGWSLTTMDSELLKSQLYVYHYFFSIDAGCSQTSTFDSRNTNFALSLIYFSQFPSLLFTAIHLRLVCTAIFFYDYVLTFGSEVEYFWPPRNRLTWPSFLFFVNRYLSLFGNILFAVEDFMNPVNFEVRIAQLRLLRHRLTPP